MMYYLKLEMAFEEDLLGVLFRTSHCSSTLTSLSTCVPGSEFPPAHRRVQEGRFWNDVVKGDVFGEKVIYMGRDLPIPSPC